MAADSKGMVLLPGERETISIPGDKVSFLRREVDSAYSMVEWAAEPGAPGTSVHIHRMTDETFYVLEGTFGFQVGEETVEGSAGAFVFAPKGTKHAFWNQGPHPARLLITMSPPEFWHYLNAWCELHGEDLSGRCPHIRVGLPTSPEGKGADSTCST